MPGPIVPNKQVPPPMTTAEATAGTVTAPRTISPAVLGAAALVNPMTGVGDFIRGGAAGVPTRLAAPSDGDYVVRFTSGVPTWAAPSGGSLTLYDKIVKYQTLGGASNAGGGVNFSLSWQSWGPILYTARGSISTEVNRANGITFGGSALRLETTSGNCGLDGSARNPGTTGCYGYWYRFTQKLGASSDFRLAVGLCLDAGNALVAINNDTYTRPVAILRWSDPAGDTEIQMVTQSGTSGPATVTGTGVVYDPTHQYEMAVVVDDNDTAYWSIYDIDTDTLTEGSVSTNVPDGTTNAGYFAQPCCMIREQDGASYVMAIGAMAGCAAPAGSFA